MQHLIIILSPKDISNGVCRTRSLLFLKLVHIMEHAAPLVPQPICTHLLLSTTLHVSHHFFFHTIKRTDCLSHVSLFEVRHSLTQAQSASTHFYWVVDNPAGSHPIIQIVHYSDYSLIETLLSYQMSRARILTPIWDRAVLDLNAFKPSQP